ncbi:MAG: hypothetical protein R3D32_08275 [Nitratireductor sp.]
MFSACIIVGENTDGLGATLGALVPAVADGVLRDAVIVDFSADPDVELVCDAAGCGRVVAKASLPLEKVGTSLRCEWLLLMMAGAVPQSGWHWSASEFIERAAMTVSPETVAAAFDYANPGFGKRDRMSELWRRISGHLLGRVAPGQGLILHRSHASPGSGFELGPQGWHKPPVAARVTVLPVTMTVPVPG